MKEIIRLHSVLSSIISYGNLILPTNFGIVCKESYEQKLDLVQLATLILTDNLEGLSNR